MFRMCYQQTKDISIFNKDSEIFYKNENTIWFSQFLPKNFKKKKEQKCCFAGWDEKWAALDSNFKKRWWNETEYGAACQRQISDCRDFFLKLFENWKWKVSEK